MSDTLAPAPSSTAEFNRAMAEAVLGSGDGRDEEAQDSGILRAILWSLTRGGQSSHVSRILNYSLERVSARESQPDERRLRPYLHGLLHELAEAGDVLELPGGYWHPAPVRLVDLRLEHDERLLVGGVPTSAVPAELRATIAHRRVFRRVRGDALREALALPSQDVDSWLGVPSLPLLKWARQVLAVELAEFSTAKESSGFQIYMPIGARRGAAQHWRWSDRPGNTSGQFLAKRTRAFGAREYRVVELRDGHVERSGDVLLPGEVRRLMYALDLTAANPVEIGYEVSDKTLALTLWSDLPVAELRLFAVLGKLELPSGRYYPRIWRIDGHHDVALERLRALGIKITPKERKWGRRNDY